MKLKEYMTENNISVTELANRTGLNKTTLKYKIRGAFRFNLTDLQLISDTLQLPSTEICDLFGLYYFKGKSKLKRA